MPEKELNRILLLAALVVQIDEPRFLK